MEDQKTFYELWEATIKGTSWEKLDVKEELELIESKAVRPRIPADHLVFRLFGEFNRPEEQIRVVLLGQDPYPEILTVPVSEDEDSEAIDTQITRACGFAFSSPHGNLPFSLKIIFREILREYPQEVPEIVRGKSRDRRAKAEDYSGDLSYLIGQGVFLLNSMLTLTVKEGDKTGGPSKLHTSWLCFTKKILNHVKRTCPDAVFVALGKPAKDLYKGAEITDAIEVDHPANARFGGRNPFLGSGVFQAVDERLVVRGLTPVNWVPMKESVDNFYFDEECMAKIGILCIHEAKDQIEQGVMLEHDAGVDPILQQDSDSDAQIEES
jgi:uracil DNA glycosylase